MASIKKSLARKAVRSTAKHTAHGTAAKLKRQPVRGATLFGLGALVGALVSQIVSRMASTPTVASPS